MHITTELSSPTQVCFVLFFEEKIRHNHMCLYPLPGSPAKTESSWFSERQYRIYPMSQGYGAENGGERHFMSSVDMRMGTYTYNKHI